MRTISFLMAILLLSASCKQQKVKENKQIKETPQWVSLFNGENFDGWTIRILGKELGENYANTFRIDSGMLKIRYDGYESFDNQFGAIYFNKPYSNYRLKLMYRFVGDTAPGAPEWGFRDSGVQYHSQSPESLKPDQPFPVCLEYNLHGGNGTDDRPTGEVCASGTTVQIGNAQNESFCTPPEVKRTFHGDQWITLEIDVRDDEISHFVNGEKILTYTNPRYNATDENGKAFIVDGEDQVSSGFISLQSNSHPIDFRKIEILEY